MKKRALTFVGCVLALSACGRTSGGEAIDSSKTQLFVSNFFGGYGDTWLRDLKAGFEEKYSEESFESGKKGVQVIITNDKTTGDNLMQRIPGSQNNVYFCESVFYYDYVNAGIMADITDLVNEDLSDLGDTGTILDKFSDQQKAYYLANDNKYYGIPHYEGFFGLTCDIDLWEEKDLFIEADPSKSDSKVDALYDGEGIVTTGKDGNKSKGPDGVKGTYDDGFPATYKEFADLMVVMRERGVIPFTWTGQYQSDYSSKFMAALQVDFEGFEQTQRMFDYDGTLTHLVNSISGGNVTYKSPTPVTMETGYKTFESAGKYYDLKFMESVVNNRDYYHKDSFKNTDSNLNAQGRYLLSNPIDKAPIAMLIEGNYWENEASDSGIFNEAAKAGPEWNRQNRKIAMMPLPKATDELVGQKSTILSSLNSLCFINKASDAVHLALAKKFLKYANTNESLVNFNLTTNAPKALNYTLSESQVNSLNYYGQSVYKLRKNSNVVQEVSKNRVFSNNVKDLMLSATYISKINFSNFNNLVKEMAPAFTSPAKNAEQLFSGIIANYDAAKWAEYLK